MLAGFVHLTRENVTRTKKNPNLLPKITDVEDEKTIGQQERCLSPQLMTHDIHWFD